jgi:hypothetical protein
MGQRQLAYTGPMDAGRGWIGIVAAVAASLGCSDAGKGNGDVSGAWCGKDVAAAAACVGDEAIYLQLTQSGSAVTGTYCEDYAATECYTLDGGTLAGSALTFSYDLPPTDSVSATLSLATSGETMTGAMTSTKCGCDIAVTLHRLD